MSCISQPCAGNYTARGGRTAALAVQRTRPLLVGAGCVCVTVFVSVIWFCLVSLFWFRPRWTCFRSDGARCVFLAGLCASQLDAPLHILYILSIVFGRTFTNIYIYENNRLYCFSARKVEQSLAVKDKEAHQTSDSGVNANAAHCMHGSP